MNTYSPITQSGSLAQIKKTPMQALQLMLHFLITSPGFLFPSQSISTTIDAFSCNKRQLCWFAGNLDGYGRAIHLISKWMKRSPDPILDNVGIWDDVITNR